MTNYSYSRISTFDTCPYKYKLQYIDNIKADIPTTVEAFMGNIVHTTLQMLYKDKRLGIEQTKQSLIKYYECLWKRNFTKDILITKEKSEDEYKKIGEKYILDYYNRMYPFNQLTIIDLETQEKLKLDKENNWYIRIDKFAKDKNNNYYICDYKTNANMKTQKEVDEDEQLAMYSIWVKDKFKNCKSIKLVWHMLAFNKDLISERTNEQLEKLKTKILNKIKTIELTKTFEKKTGKLCNYCIYKNICQKSQ